MVCLDVRGWGRPDRSTREIQAHQSNIFLMPNAAYLRAVGGREEYGGECEDMGRKTGVNVSVKRA